MSKGHVFAQHQAGNKEFRHIIFTFFLNTRMQNNICFPYHIQYFDNILVNQHFPNDWSHIGKDTYKVHECEKVRKVHWFSFTFQIAINQPLRDTTHHVLM